ncbi:hypothetical protein ACFL3V_06970 [Nanoarchaeota archaeon]
MSSDTEQRDRFFKEVDLGDLVRVQYRGLIFRKERVMQGYVEAMDLNYIVLCSVDPSENKTHMWRLSAPSVHIRHNCVEGYTVIEKDACDNSHIVKANLREHVQVDFRKANIPDKKYIIEGKVVSLDWDFLTLGDGLLHGKSILYSQIQKLTPLGYFPLGMPR